MSDEVEGEGVAGCDVVVRHFQSGGFLAPVLGMGLLQVGKRELAGVGFDEGLAGGLFG